MKTKRKFKGGMNFYKLLHVFILCALVFNMSFMGVFFVTSDASADDSGQPAPKTICHATGSVSNPYETIHVNEASLNGHDTHSEDLILDGHVSCPVPDPECISDDDCAEGYTCGQGTCMPVQVDCDDTDEDGVCDKDEIDGCTDPEANNFAPAATEEDGSCEYPVLGCTDIEAINYDSLATENDDSCEYYGEYCGDGEVNQNWEECDGADNKSNSDCTDQCQFDDGYCSEKVFARVNIPEDGVTNGTRGDMTSNIYLGSSSYVIPQGTWFLLSENEIPVIDADVAGYEDVEGLAVERTGNSVRAVLYGTREGKTKDIEEHVDGNIEFFNAAVGDLSSDESNDKPKNNRLEKGFDGSKGNAGDDEVWTEYGDVNHSYFWLTTTTADDGYYTDWSIVETCEDVCGNGLIDDEEDCDAGYNGSDTCTSECEEIVVCGEGFVELLNPGFEEPVVTGSTWKIYTGLETGWNLSPDEMELQRGVKGWLPSEGAQYAELDTNQATEISQSVETFIGVLYTVYYDFSPRPGVDKNELELYIDDSFIQTTGNVDGSNLEQTDWTPYSYSFVATSDNTIIAFKDVADSNGVGTFIDNVRLEIMDCVPCDMTISGYKMDEDENKLGNWEIGLYDIDGLIATTSTDDSDDNKGFYTFEGLCAGDYEVHEVMQAGWEQIYPLQETEQDYCDISLSKIEDGDRPWCYFTNKLLPVCEAGIVFTDGFEEPEVTHELGWDIFTNSLNWMVAWLDATDADPSLELHGGVNNWLPQEGSQYAELDGDWFGPDGGGSGNAASVKIYRDVETFIDARYIIDFFFSPRPGTGIEDNKIEVYVNGTLEYTYEEAGGSANNWTPHMVQFTADSESTTIEFRDGGTANSRGTFIDDISLELISCNPEPECDYSIEGYKMHANDEMYLESWVIELYDGEDGFIASTTTNSNGWYQFTELCAGDYKIYEVMQDGWRQTYPFLTTSDIHHEVTLGGEKLVLKILEEERPRIKGYNFVNETGICGYKYSTHDDLGIEDWNIYLKEIVECEEGDEWADFVESYSPVGTIPAERADATKALGSTDEADEMNFVSLGFGGEIILGFENRIINGTGADVQVFETSFGSPNCDAYPEYMEVYAYDHVNSVYVKIGGPECQDGANVYDLGSLEYTYYIKIVDTTDSGDFNGGDGYDLDAVKALHCGYEEIIDETITDENGYYCFFPESGDYRVEEETREGWSYNNYYYMDGNFDGIDPWMVDFWNTPDDTPDPKGSITVCKYDDADDSKVIEAGELTLEGWGMNLWTCPFAPPYIDAAYSILSDVISVGDCVISDTQMTEDDGCYTWENKGIGWYKVSENLKPGWKQTYISNANTFWLYADQGEDVTINIANHEEPEPCTGNCCNGGCGSETDYGCTDPKANNYDSSADVDDKSCTYNSSTPLCIIQGTCGRSSVTEETFDDVQVLGEEGAPSLSITKEVSADIVNPGDTVDYKIVVTNNGNLPAFNVIVKDELPEGLVFAEDESTIFSWTLGDMAENESKDITYKVNILETALENTYTNTAVASADNHDSVSATADLEVITPIVLAESGIDFGELALMLVLSSAAIFTSRRLRGELLA